MTVILVALSNPVTIPGELCTALHSETDCSSWVLAGKGLADVGRCWALLLGRGNLVQPTEV